jgi:hypothetical protein
MHGCSKLFFWTLLLFPVMVSAQTCQKLDEIPGEAKLALQNSAQRVFDQATRGDIDAMKANAIPSLQANFMAIAAAVHDNQAAMTSTRLQLRTIFLLDTGPKPDPDGRFFCGVFGANGLDRDYAVFDIPGIPSGRYGVVIEDIVGSQGRFALTVIFQDTNGWKLGGFYIRPESARGHDGIWYLAQARQYKSKGQNLNAWFYYEESWQLLAPVTFMENKLLADIIKESDSVRPVDVPLGGTPISFSASGRTYRITEITVLADKHLDLVIKYSLSDSVNINAAAPNSEQLAAAYAAKYPELKDGFDRLFAVAVDPNGREVTAGIELRKQ